MWYDHPFSQRNNNRKSSGVGVGGNREEGEGGKNFKKWGVGNIGGGKDPSASMARKTTTYGTWH